MADLATDVERYIDPAAFAREVNLPVLGSATLAPIASGASLSSLLAASAAGDLDPIVESLVQTRQSLTLRSLLLAGFPTDPECFALGLALGRAWSRRGLRVAVVDVDGWNPTIVRPVGEPNEGLVDMLEYGCSFRRAAWDLVAESLWVVGPGSHPAEEARLADHPDWDRVSRVFAAHVDVALFVAPLLHKPGLTGRLSKRMDGVVLTVSVERVGRPDLRDAFLELWGSDAPIIGCAAIVPGGGYEGSAGAARGEAAASSAEVARRAGVRPSAVAPGALSAAVPAAAPASEGPRHSGSKASAEREPASEGAAAYERKQAEDREAVLAVQLEREVRAAEATARPGGRIRAEWIWRALAVAAAAVAGVAVWMAFFAHPRPSPVGSEIRTAGEETVLPAPDGPTETRAQEASGGTTPATGETPSPPAGPGGGITGGSAAGAAGQATTPGASTAPLNVGPPAEGKPFRVHVSSFRTEEMVASTVRDLRLRGADAWYELSPDGSGWFRVFIGRFATEDEAAAYAVWLMRNKWVTRAHAYPSSSR